MLHISFYGFANLEYNLIKIRVFKVLNYINLASKTVMEFVPSVTENCDSRFEKTIFIRVASTGGIDEIKKVIESLQNDGIDYKFQMLVLDGFVEKK